MGVEDAKEGHNLSITFITTRAKSFRSLSTSKSGRNGKRDDNHLIFSLNLKKASFSYKHFLKS